MYVAFVDGNDSRLISGRFVACKHVSRKELHSSPKEVGLRVKVELDMSALYAVCLRRRTERCNVLRGSTGLHVTAPLPHQAIKLLLPSQYAGQLQRKSKGFRLAFQTCIRPALTVPRPSFADDSQAMTHFG